MLGEYQTNCYVLRETEQADQCLIIDAGLAAEQLLDFLSERKITPVAAILTHGHIDHIAGIALLRENYPDIEVSIHRGDAEMLTEPMANLSTMMGSPFSTEPAQVLLEDGSLIERAGIELQILHVPGHSPGGICLYSSEMGVVFTDDALFADSIGRTDFPGGSMTELLKSIKQKLWPLPDETVVYPGHGPSSTIGREKKYNSFLQ